MNFISLFNSLIDSAYTLDRNIDDLRLQMSGWPWPRSFYRRAHCRDDIVHSSLDVLMPCDSSPLEDHGLIPLLPQSSTVVADGKSW